MQSEAKFKEFEPRFKHGWLNFCFEIRASAQYEPVIGG